MTKYITREEAYEFARDIVGKHEFTDKNDDFIEHQLNLCRNVEWEGKQYLVYDDLKSFNSNFLKWLEESDSAQLRRRRGAKTEYFADIIEFVESPEYMNLAGSIFGPVKDALWTIWHEPDKNYLEIVLTGATGTGKSFIAEMCISYMLYKLSIFYDPQAEIELAPGSPLYFVLQSGSLQQAVNILFKPLYNRLALTNYFTKVFPFQKDIRSELIFPNSIIVRPFSGNDDAVLGLTVLGGAVTELNRMAYTTKSKRRGNVKTAEEQVYDQAVAIYTTVIRRMVSRTMQLGKLWGKLVLDAAHEHEEDFTSNKIREAETNPTIYIYKKMQWEVVPSKRFSGEKFLIEVGNDVRRSRFVQHRDEAIEPDKVIEVPIEYKQWFMQDIEGALRDFGGFVVGVQQPAIPYREKIAEGVEMFQKMFGDAQLFYHDSVILQEYKGFQDEDEWHRLVNEDYLRGAILDKKVEFVCHVDPGLSHDAMGIAVGHIVGWSLLPPVKKYNARNKRYEERRDIRAPILAIDGILQVKGPYGEEVDLEMAQRLIIYLSGIMNLTTVSMDSYQSAQMLQACRVSGIVAGPVSVDDTLEPYTRVKIAYRDGRLFTPGHKIYKDEILNLQMDGKKYDHLVGMTKDCSDAVAGVVYLLETHVADYIPENPRRQGVSEVEPGAGKRRGRLLTSYGKRARH
jgi:hypothetical protein